MLNCHGVSSRRELGSGIRPIELGKTARNVCVEYHAALFVKIGARPRHQAPGANRFPLQARIGSSHQLLDWLDATRTGFASMGIVGVPSEPSRRRECPL